MFSSFFPLFCFAFLLSEMVSIIITARTIIIERSFVLASVTLTKVSSKVNTPPIAIHFFEEIYNGFISLLVKTYSYCFLTFFKFNNSCEAQCKDTEPPFFFHPFLLSTTCPQQGRTAPFTKKKRCFS